MTDLTISPRADQVLGRIVAWAHRGRLRAGVVKLGVTVVGPLIVLAGLAMLVLPGPGLVVMALGLTLLALEYEWARRLLHLLGRGLSFAREAALPRGASQRRRLIGVGMVGVFIVASFAATTAITAFLGAHTFL